MRDTPRQDALNLAATAEGARRLAEDYLATLRALGPGAKRVTDKALNNFMLLGRPPPRLPQRDPHPLPAPSDRHRSIDLYHELRDEPSAIVSDRSDLVFYIRQYQRLMAHWREVLPAESVRRGGL